MPRFMRPDDWYWLVNPNPTTVYHSARQVYVALDDAAYVAFLADGNVATVIASETELRDLLASAEVQYLAEPLPATEIRRPRLPRARCRLQIASFALASATPTAVPWNNELDDPLNMHGPGNPDRIVIAEAGIWRVDGTVRFAASPTGLRAAQFRVGPGNIVATSRHAPAPELESEFPVGDYFAANQGDVLRMFLEQRSGGPLDITARMTLLRFA